MVGIIKELETQYILGKGVKLKYINGKGQKIITGIFHDMQILLQFINALKVAQDKACATFRAKN